MGWRCSTACSFGLLCVLKGYGAGPVLTLCGLVGLGEHRTGKLDNKGIQLDFMDAGGSPLCNTRITCKLF